MLVFVLCTACFFRAKINKKTLLPLLLDLAPYFECSGAGTVTDTYLVVECKENWFLNQSK